MMQALLSHNHRLQVGACHTLKAELSVSRKQPDPRRIHGSSRTCVASAEQPPRRRVRFRVPDHMTEMPPVASTDVALLGLGPLISHLREAALRWQVHYPPFWQAGLARLGELRGEVRLREAARLLVIFASARLVDLDMVRHCEELVAEAADSEGLLDFREAELLQVAAALAKMRRPEATGAMEAVLRPLIVRAHRLEVGLLLQALTAACDVDSDSGVAGELLDAVARTAVERGAEDAEALAALSGFAGKLALQKRCRLGPRSGVDLLYRHVLRRAREEPGQFGVFLPRLREEAQQAGCATLAWESLSEGEK